MSHAIKVFNTLRGNVLCKNYTRSKYLRNYSNDNSKLVIPSSTAPPDYLLQNLKNATNSQTVLDLVGTHYKIMNSQQLVQALKSLFTLQKYGNSTLSTQQIVKHPNFVQLCQSLKSQSGMIKLNDTLVALKVISFVGVPSNSTIVQVLLQLLRHSVNDISLQSIIFLDFLLKQFKSSPLVDGLLIALPVVFEVNLPVKLDRENITQSVECLNYASTKNVSQKCIEIIVNSLIKAIDFGGDLDAKTANSILWSLSNMQPDQFYEPLFKRAMDILLTEGFDCLNYQDVMTVMTKISYKASAKYLFYYNDVFYDSCADYIIHKDLGFEEAVFTLLKFNRINHTNDNLLNYVSRKFDENPALLKNASPLVIYILTAYIAQSEYRPTYWPAMKKAIQSNICLKNDNKRDILWLKFAASLCSLDIYKYEVIEKALETGYLKYIINEGFVGDYDHFLLIVQALNTFEPNYKHLLPDNSFMQTILSKVKPIVQYPLEGALQKALGDENCINTCLKTALYHHIDHVIIMRKGGYAVPLTKNYQYIEDIEVPEDGFIILVLALDQRHYTINTKRLSATTLLRIKTLEAKGYSVVPICMEVWERLQDFERIPFVMQAIRLKVETLTEMSSAVC